MTLPSSCQDARRVAYVVYLVSRNWAYPEDELLVDGAMTPTGRCWLAIDQGTTGPPTRAWGGSSRDGYIRTTGIERGSRGPHRVNFGVTALVFVDNTKASCWLSSMPSSGRSWVHLKS